MEEVGVEGSVRSRVSEWVGMNGGAEGVSVYLRHLYLLRVGAAAQLVFFMVIKQATVTAFYCSLLRLRGA